MFRIQRVGAIVIALIAGTSPSSWAAITISVPIVSSGGGVATSTTFSASTTIGQPVAGVATGTNLVIVSGLAPSIVGVTVGAPPAQLPQVTRLSRIAPNPFRMRATIAFEIATPALTTVRVFDASGRLVRTLLDRQLEPGRYSLEWDGAGLDGEPTGAGIYFCQFRSGTASETQRITFVR